MNNKLARNLLIHRQTATLAAAFSARGITCIVLKGAALIALFPRYSADRVMDDIDLLFHPREIANARTVLTTLGYQPCTGDPCAWRHPDTRVHPVPVDVTDELWYLRPRELDRAIAESIPLTIETEGSVTTARCLKPVDMYLHVAAHAAVHHGSREDTWLTDIGVMNTHWGELLATDEGKKKCTDCGLEYAIYAYLSEGAAPGLYGMVVRSSSPRKGHILRFICLPLSRKVTYLARTLFPSDHFISVRYGVTRQAYILLYRYMLRPALLLHALAGFIVNNFRDRRFSSRGHTTA